ncbi:hypothetical protein HY030_03515 [Candidatus Gottesmanbacteria bacterium]|nr:hypothetical protein [Candidatus Gottesmanbacteria bacterium]
MQSENKPYKIYARDSEIPFQKLDSRARTRFYPGMFLIDPQDSVCLSNGINEHEVVETNLLLIETRKKFFSKFASFSNRSYSEGGFGLSAKQRDMLARTGDPYDRIAIRCRGQTPDFCSDFDGTFTRGFNEQMLAHIPNGTKFEDSLKKCSDPRWFALMYVKYMQDSLKKKPHLFEKAAMYAKLRPGSLSTLEFMYAHGIFVDIISRQFNPIVIKMFTRQRKKHQLPGGMLIHAIESDNITSMWKGYYVANAAMRGGRPVMMAGDSLIDASSLGPYGYDTLAGIFVLKASVLERDLDRKDIPSRYKDYIERIPYTNFNDIRRAYEKIIQSCSVLTSQNIQFS